MSRNPPDAVRFDEPFNDVISGHVPVFIGWWPETNPQLTCESCGQITMRACPAKGGAEPCRPGAEYVPEAHDHWQRWLDEDLVPATSGAAEVQKMQIGCTCGWRSPVMDAPPLTTAGGGMGDERDKSRVQRLWLRHLAEVEP